MVCLKCFVDFSLIIKFKNNRWFLFQRGYGKEFCLQTFFLITFFFSKNTYICMQMVFKNQTFYFLLYYSYLKFVLPLSHNNNGNVRKRNMQQLKNERLICKLGWKFVCGCKHKVFAFFLCLLQRVRQKIKCKKQRLPV